MPCEPWMFVISVNTNFWAMSTRVQGGLSSEPVLSPSIPSWLSPPLPALALPFLL